MTDISVAATKAWQALQQHANTMKEHLSTLLTEDQGRLERCVITRGELRLNYALNRVTPETIKLLTELATQQKLSEWRSRLLSGEKINLTEKRAVLHSALRQKGGSVFVDGQDVIPEIQKVRARIGGFVDAVRGGAWKGATGKRIRHIVNIGIGGSDLGPRLAVEALAPFGSELSVHFAANADAFDLLSILKKLDPAETLFTVVSKTFTTQETLLNARTARHWLVAALGEAAVGKHFAAVSVNKDAVGKFGIAADNMFPMWDWVGGRFSVWSAVGIAVALAIGNDHFASMCEGAAAMDQHFRDAPLDQNMPVMLALLGIWQRNFLGSPAVAILPYSERLRNLPRFLQQLEMESNGKSVTRDGSAVGCETAPILFGECGTVGQHSFHQWLHQGTTPIPADFIGVINDDLGQPEHHKALLSNMTAQASALAFGQQQAANPHDIYAGNRSSNLILLEKLDPHSFGMLVALYEHKTFVQGIVWGINSFDQPGVELGKAMAKMLENAAPTTSPMAVFTKTLFENVTS